MNEQEQQAPRASACRLRTMRFQAREQRLGSHENHMCYQWGSCAGTDLTFLHLGISSCDVLAESLEQEEKPAPLCLAMLPLKFFEKARLRVRVHSSSVHLGNRSEMDSDQRDVLPFISDFTDSLSKFISLKRSTFFFKKKKKHLFPQTNKVGMLSACLLGFPIPCPI